MTLADQLIEGVNDPLFALQVVAAVGAAVSVWMLLGSLGGGGQLERRMKNVTQRREQLRQHARGLRKTEKDSLYKRIVDVLGLRRQLMAEGLELRLLRAGIYAPSAVTMFYFARFTLPFVFAALAGFYLFVIEPFEMDRMRRIVLTFGALVFGYYAPSIYLVNKAQTRLKSIMQSFPDALDLLLICVETGMSVEGAFQKVADEIGSASTELAQELNMTTAELNYLEERRGAYENLGKRVNHVGVKAVCTALIQSERYGTPVGHSLRVMADENRQLRIAEAEKKGAALPAKLTVPMIVFFLPVLFVVIIGPAMMEVTSME